MNIVLSHPVHGAKIATLEAELEADLRNGWAIVPEFVKIEKSEPDIDEGLEIIKNSMPPPRTKRRTV